MTYSQQVCRDTSSLLFDIFDGQSWTSYHISWKPDNLRFDLSIRWTCPRGYISKFQWKINIFQTNYLLPSSVLGEIHLVHLCSIAFLLVATIGLYWVYLIDKVKLITKKSSLIILIDYMGFQIQRFFKWFVLFSASSSLRWLLTLYSLSQPNCSLHTAEPLPPVFALHSVVLE